MDENLKDYSILFKLMSMTREEAKVTASNESKSKERIEKYRNDAAGFMRCYFPHYVRLEQAPWQKALLNILSKPTWDARKNCYVWKMSKEQADELKKLEREENKQLVRTQKKQEPPIKILILRCVGTGSFPRGREKKRKVL